MDAINPPVTVSTTTLAYKGSKHCAYMGLYAVQTPSAHSVGPVQPSPPHWPYSGALGPLEVVVGATVDVVKVVAGGVVVVVPGVPPPGLKPLTIWLTWLTMAAICTPATGRR